MTSPCFEMTSGSPLGCVVEDAHEQAAAALAAETAAPLDAVVWLSAHLAAVARTVTPVSTRRLDEPAGVRREAHRRDLELERMLRIAERRHSGDVLAAGFDAARLRDALVQRLRLHTETEHARLVALAEVLTPGQQRALAGDYLEAVVKAPTRPHPHLPHQGVAGARAVRVDAVRDHLLDTMDG